MTNIAMSNIANVSNVSLVSSKDAQKYLNAYINNIVNDIVNYPSNKKMMDKIIKKYIQAYKQDVKIKDESKYYKTWLRKIFKLHNKTVDAQIQSLNAKLRRKNATIEEKYGFSSLNDLLARNKVSSLEDFKALKNKKYAGGYALDVQRVRYDIFNVERFKNDKTGAINTEALLGYILEKASGTYNGKKYNKEMINKLSANRIDKISKSSFEKFGYLTGQEGPLTIEEFTSNINGKQVAEYGLLYYYNLLRATNNDTQQWENSYNLLRWMFLNNKGKLNDFLKTKLDGLVYNGVDLNEFTFQYREPTSNRSYNDDSLYLYLINTYFDGVDPRWRKKPYKKADGTYSFEFVESTRYFGASSHGTPSELQKEGLI